MKKKLITLEDFNPYLKLLALKSMTKVSLEEMKNQQQSNTIRNLMGKKNLNKFPTSL